MARQVNRLIGVYDADGTLRGELTYWLKARVGKAHCSLCEVTHGLVRRRPEWQACAAALPVEFLTFHRNDQPERVRAATGNVTPVVMADTDQGTVLLLGPQQLEQCNGDPSRLDAAIHSAMAGLDLEWCR